MNWWRAKRNKHLEVGVRKTAEGKPLWKRLTVKFIANKGTLIKERTVTAQPGVYFTEDDIQKSLEGIAADLEKKFPGVEWRMVELEPNRFNFVTVEKEPNEDANARGSQVAEDRGEGVRD